MNLTFKMMYWGPLLFKCEMSKQHVKQLKQIINVKNPHNTKLAGDIKDQHQLTISQMDKFREITNGYMQAFGRAYQTYYNKKGKLFVDVVDIWTNFMKPGDFNPIHVHYGCEFSSVIFLDVPDKLIKEQKSFKGTGYGPASLTFLTSVDKKDFITSHSFHPTTGQFFIFPKDLYHFVTPFKSKCTRISMAANFNVSCE